MPKALPLLTLLLLPTLTPAADLQIGAARTDVTPTTPIRLSGYAARKTESDGVAQKLYARALAVGATRADAAVLVTVDTMALPGDLVETVAARLKSKANLPRERLAICATHTHAAPCLTNAAPNIFGHDLPPDQQARIDAYTRELADKLERTALAALDDLRPGTLHVARGSVNFAANRRKPPTPDTAGPVDHELPVLIARGADGAVRAVVANYACHCTTGGADINQVHGDWAGFASDNLEAAHKGAVALITIGCGADANPKPRGTLDLARQQGAALAHEVSRLIKAPTPITLSAAPEGKINVIALPYDKLPTKPELEKLAERADAIGYNAKVQLARLAKDGRLPDSLPYTVQTWRFGDDLAMVFLAGEVVVDYARRLKHDFDPARLWVTAYANDVPCYIPSRRILAEGGYEAEGAMVYYARPARLAPSVENDIVRAVHALLPTSFRTKTSLEEFPPPKSPADAPKTLKVDGDAQIELVAAEPLVQSPVAIDWDLKGRLWVVEMIDFPDGLHDNGRPGGRVKVLEDTDRDGRYDKATVFLDNLPQPQGLMCWRGGVLVCAAPRILYATDDNDLHPDAVTALFTGFGPDNQQWAVNGLSWGLDGQVHGASSIQNRVITGDRSGKSFDLGARDFRFDPDAGLLEPVAGRTQFGRVRDDWNHWFGNDNSTPLLHYPLDDRYARRAPHAPLPPSRVRVTAADKDGQRLFPASRTLARFNEPQSANRVTSACGPTLYRDYAGHWDSHADPLAQDAFFCEPVHNVVRRLVLTPNGGTFAARRAPADQREFLASTDNWFRPVQTRTGPDGALWVVDMHRFVVEHPRWITKQRLATLDTRAGHDRGRIYRVLPKGRTPRPIEDLSKLDTAHLAARLDHPNGVVRDLVHRELTHRKDATAIPTLTTVAQTSPHPAARAQALWALDGLRAPRPDLLKAALTDADPRVRRTALRLSETVLDDAATDPAARADLESAALRLGDDPDPAVRQQAVLSLGHRPGDAPLALTRRVLAAAPQDPWVRAAVLIAAAPRPLPFFENARADGHADLATALAVMVAASTSDARDVEHVLLALLPADTAQAATPQWNAAADVLDALARRNPTLPEAAAARVRAHAAVAATRAADDQRPLPERLAACRLISRDPTRAEADLRTASNLLDARHLPSLQAAALAALVRSKDAPAAAQAMATALPRVSPATRSQLLDALTARPATAAALLTAVEQKQLSPTDVPAPAREKLLAHADATVRDRATQLLTVERPPARATALRAFEPALTLAGDPARGRPLFERACAACHRLGDLGHPVGPDLAALTDKSPTYLLTAIVDPNAAVEGQYVAYQLDTTDGDTHVGLLAEETAAALTLNQPSGLKQTIPRPQLKSLTATKLSLMPEGLEQGLTPQALADLIAYTRTPAPVR
jgi:putative membrane-bound dehydrogenase-like protein